MERTTPVRIDDSNGINSSSDAEDEPLSTELSQFFCYLQSKCSDGASVGFDAVFPATMARKGAARAFGYMVSLAGKSLLGLEQPPGTFGAIAITTAC